ncbi:PilN family type IVB pilus formation outer membrane protein [Rahnella sp. BCC 1045]|nr:PilN family type IVB pilus formation outer membrane protein [Rahnella sp. BCC 1045]
MTRLSALALLCLSLTSCSTLDGVDATAKRAEQDGALADAHLQALKSGQVVRDLPSQWINPVPLNDAPGQTSSLPPCAVSINRPGAVSLAYISSFISDTCHIPVVVTPDALAMLNGGATGGATEKMSGPLPAPDANGMMPLGTLGLTGGSRPPAAAPGGAMLLGVSWNGEAGGLLDNETTRLGLSWRFEYGHVAIFYLDTRNYPVMFMDSLTGFDSKTVSGTTSSSGSAGGNSSGISGDANTSQSTTSGIKTNLYKDISETVKSMLTPGSGRSNLSSGVLTVTDTPRVLDQIGRYLDDRNRELNRQVKIFVQVFSVERRNQHQLGIDYNAVLTTGSVASTLVSPFTGVASDALSGGATILDGQGKGTAAFLRALDEQANVSAVTEATALTTNMSAAPIQVALQQDYVPNVSTSQTANVGSSTSISSSTVTTGFNMTALPFLIPNSSKMQLNFSISMSDDPTFTDYLSGTSKSQLMKTRLKTFTQRVIMQSGQTLVLSGYQQMNNTANHQGVGSYRFFGLGGGARSDDDRNELVILITPVLMG